MGRLTYEKLCDILQHVNRVTFILDGIGEESYSSQEVHEAIKELQRYKDLEEQGRLIELPCAVGDTVWTYWIDDDRLGVERYKPANEPLCILVKDLWGIKFFATKEEAEEKMIAKLKELEE